MPKLSWFVLFLDNSNRILKNRGSVMFKRFESWRILSPFSPWETNYPKLAWYKLIFLCPQFGGVHKFKVYFFVFMYDSLNTQPLWYLCFHDGLQQHKVSRHSCSFNAALELPTHPVHYHQTFQWQTKTKDPNSPTSQMKFISIIENDTSDIVVRSNLYSYKNNWCIQKP